MERVRIVARARFMPYSRIKYRVPRAAKLLRAWDFSYLLFPDGRWSVIGTVNSWRLPGEPRHYSHRHPCRDVTKALPALVQLGLVSDADAAAVRKLDEKHDDAKRSKDERKRDMRDLRRTAKRLGFKVVRRAR